MTGTELCRCKNCSMASTKQSSHHPPQQHKIPGIVQDKHRSSQAVIGASMTYAITEMIKKGFNECRKLFRGTKISEI